MNTYRNQDFEKDSYEVQLLGFTTQIVCDYVDSMIKENIQSRTESLKLTLLGKFPLLRTAVVATTEIFLKEALHCVEKHFHQVTSAVNEFFAIPPNVLLPEDVLQSRQYTEDEQQLLDKEIQQLKCRAKRTCFMEEILQKEAEEIQKVRNSKLEQNEVQLHCCESEVNDKVNHIVQYLAKIRDLGKINADSSNKKNDTASELRFQCM